jgi:heme exporter protein A
MIRAEKITKSFRHQPVLRDLDFQAEPGTCTVLLGDNGAGKTTLLRILAGLTRPDAGSVLIHGRPHPADPQEVRRLIGFFSHHTMLYDDLSPLQNLLFFSRLYGVPDADSRIQSLLERAGLAPRRNDPVRGLSHGMQQRLALLRTILHDPAVLLLDEPTRGLDRQAMDFLHSLLDESIQQNKTILLSTHMPASLSVTADRYLNLHNGSLHLLESTETPPRRPGGAEHA